MCWKGPSNVMERVLAAFMFCGCSFCSGPVQLAPENWAAARQASNMSTALLRCQLGSGKYS
ncbi:hypothetical protein IG631_18072 [Alternaria alternata]|nr:hypothetical protein IG631_18072 [Alternaria alternata]